MGFSVDMSDFESPEDVEAGSSIVPDWYKCEVLDVSDDPKGGAIQWQFKVLEGAYRGAVIRDRLMDPSTGADDGKVKKLTQRCSMYLKRLEIIKPEDYGSMVDPEWEEAIGRQCWLKVVAHEYDATDRTTGQKTGVKIQTTQIAFDGVYAIDDERVPAVKAALAKAGAPGKGNVAGAGKGGKTPLFDQQAEHAEMTKAATAALEEGKPPAGKPRRQKPDYGNL
jgi:hypothetical protein